MLLLPVYPLLSPPGIPYASVCSVSLSYTFLARQKIHVLKIRAKHIHAEWSHLAIENSHLVVAG